MKGLWAKRAAARGRRACLATLICVLGLAALPAGAEAASQAPLFIYTPESSPYPRTIPPPGRPARRPLRPRRRWLGPLLCGRLLPRHGRRLQASAPVPVDKAPTYLGQSTGVDPANGPCGLALDSAGRFYANCLHGKVSRYASFPGGAKSTLDPGPATGVAVDPTTDDVYVDRRTYVAVYDSTGAVDRSRRPNRSTSAREASKASKRLRRRRLGLPGHRRLPLRPRRGQRHGQGL